MAFARSAHDWDDSYTGNALAPWDLGRPQPAFARLADLGALSGRLLDAGCGTGEHAMLAASHGAQALGIDISPRAIEIARGKAADRGIDAAFEVRDAQALGATGWVFDTVVDCGLFHVFDDADCAGYVAAVGSVLRPGGHLHLMCFSDRQGGDWGPRRVTEDELRAAFGTGWRIDGIIRDRFDLKPGVAMPTAEAWLVDVVRLPSPERSAGS
jgi:SAM-dependent methyltransferase